MGLTRALIPLPQVLPPLPRQPLRLRLPPRIDAGMIARPEHFGHLEAAILGRPGVTRRAQEPVVMRIAAGALVIAQGAREEPHHRVEDADRRRLAAREDEIAHRK